jgi:hypothetical protein
MRRKTGFQLSAGQVLSTAEVSTLYGVRLRPAHQRRTDEALGELVREIETAVQQGRMHPDQAERLVVLPEIDHIRGIKGEEAITLRALVARMPNWFADDMLVCDAMRRDRAWNGIAVEPAVTALDPVPIAVGRGFKEGAAECRRRGRTTGLSWTPPPLQTVVSALLVYRELRMSWPAPAKGRTETWSRLLSPKHRVVVDWSEDRIDVGHTPDAESPDDLGTFAAVRLPVAGDN